MQQAFDVENQDRKPRDSFPYSPQHIQNPPTQTQKLQENNITNKKDNEKTKDQKIVEPKISFFKLFRYATKFDWILMTVGAIAAIANGIALPLFALIFGQMTDSFGPTSTGDQIVDAAGTQSLYFLYIGLGTFFLSWVQMSCWMISGERQSITFRKEYFKAVLSQEVGWYDMINPNELASKIATECFQIQGAIGEKVPTYLMTVFMTLGGFAVGYARGWQMALVTTAALPVLTIGALAFSIVIQTSQKKIASSYETAGGLAEQGLNAVRTVKSLTGEEFELKNYKKGLIEAFKIACRYGFWAGAGLGLTFCTMFLDYALSFWYGSKLIGDGTTNQTLDRNYTQGDIFVVFFAIMIGGFSLGQMGPCVKSFAIGKQAAIKVFEVLERKPLIQLPPNPKRIENLQGKIILDKVNFNYPAKADIPVHKNLSLIINPNQKTALVGESGCGKSTVMQLLLRFYDPQQGSISVDGVNVKELDYLWFRKNVGYVGQEPVLFATTIRENLKFGKEDATEEEMIAALKQANAWEFVKDLQNKLDTYVGNAGSQISGGQKQRICIARAILKNPQILLLDEATSALDRKNEAMIQQTLDDISKGRTTIVIAHRLSTIKNADRILVLEKGELVEEGTYESLINARGKFEALAKNQIQREQEDKQDLQGDNDEENHLKSMDQPAKRKSSTNPAQIHHHNNSQSQSKRNSQQIDAPGINLEEKKDKKPLTKEELKKLKEEESGMMKRLYEINKPERIYFYLGALFALLNGTMFPLSGFVLGEFVEVLSKPWASDFREKADLLSLLFVFLAIGSQVFTTLQQYLFTRVGEGLTLRVRQDVYKKMLRMPAGWFDRPENNPGSLSARLSVDAHLINSLTSNVVSIQIQNFSALATGLISAFTNSWRVSLIALAVSPIMIIAGQLQAKFVQGFSESTDDAYKDSGMLIMESVTNIRTVASFANEKKVSQFYDEKLVKPYEIVVKKGNYSGVAFGFSQLAMFGVYAIIFICGAIFVRDNGVTIKEMFVSIFTILFAAFGAGNANQFMSDVGAAKNACKGLFKILDSEDEIQISEKYSNNLITERVFGDIEFRNVSFKYPTRDAQVFENLSFKIQKGQKVAFVGPSGSGKSSVLQLLLRFYDNYEGEIFVDGKDIRSYNLKEFRRSFGVVSQEPILFNGSISENIRYSSEDVGHDDIREAARRANALTFIEANQFESEQQNEHQTLGSGFDRKVGPKGSQISGGQKQRIAIARAIIKNPNVLLLDEATSALDHENEKIVQEALNSVMKGKTSLCVAHRISTIKDSDQIFVIESGKLVEQGTYDQLMSNKSYFYRLNAH
ncbi:multidrug resistance protein-like transporter family ABC domain protein (macronuclear) [Tetrahymena thermophila SB210]|uniref:Multidrug resistance protein-like transporter family ABC domain protein n=1 Tax=Tetrahymena thermophila (strain SB210) TaxID=312017 RepID=A4VD54_TETTS|nr:multidrug resistance protein-like transporter family ABC domain protein [Tetrahymena thermophila SB210]EDK31467.1 multidrug resistance protein-like transporter family ABC domain protein [Tetrahymena thermophila SB210]|eukprot:XP_001470965.1 multidrug resistance protein-like transporter family ABC domain protein [Tetrahymena thermophila SB210]